MRAFALSKSAQENDRCDFTVTFDRRNYLHFLQESRENKNYGVPEPLSGNV